ncbi:6-hydroxytryprostatin B O-methyltransferase [Tolypocladium ophioglossoides CBS 100239]|uniref:6-hydroxytryprostatin B O-methyltransferase n=1 Tax=Tolypocladium ophioglossoides (strain CBS 100239) TaxID=1163406 RepID=A0A0L0NNH2_TOLOC|nr:6-hydroxytryprostatin B O-methyltransferase [Tolypocladium ophioglossoides CBS 100239]
MKKTERDAIIEHVTQIKHLVHDPNSFLTELMVQQQQYHSIGWLCHFDVLSCIPIPPGALLYAEVAARAKVPVSTLRSVARMAMTAGLLCETKDGHLGHNPLSASFIKNVHMRTQLLHMFNQTVPILAGLARATEKWGDTTAPNETAYNLVNETDLPFFQHLKSRPDVNDNFDAFMRSQAVSHTGSRAEYLLDACDWKALGDATVVDVGGSSGSTATMLATAYPKLKLVVEDLAGPVNNARSRVLELPEEVRSRIDIVEYDFFTPQPVEGADVYLLRKILHDWPDATAILILQGIIEAMRPSSQLLIMDMVLPKPWSESRTFEAALRQKDLTMKQVFNAKEREVDEWRALLTKADPRLSIRAIQRPGGSELSVIVATLGGGSRLELANGVNGHNEDSHSS